MTFTKRFIACSVCTVDLAFMLNVMQCKEILYIICKIAIIVNQNIIEDVRRIKMKTKIRSPSLCKDCLDDFRDVVKQTIFTHGSQTERKHFAAAKQGGRQNRSPCFLQTRFTIYRCRRALNLF
jgi:hypothetical protein